LRDLVEFLGTLPARRKALLYMSTGFTHRLDVGQVLGAASGARTLREFCHERIEPGPNIVSCRPSQELHRVLVAAARGNVAIYPISPAGNQGVGRDYNFLDLAAATGGLAITDTNPRPLMQQIARENGAYYRLGIESGHKAQDGKMVPIAVRVTRPGVRVLSRSSFRGAFSRREGDRDHRYVDAARRACQPARHAGDSAARDDAGVPRRQGSRTHCGDRRDRSTSPG
jgi:hypothetical protein